MWGCALCGSEHDVGIILTEGLFRFSERASQLLPSSPCGLFFQKCCSISSRLTSRALDRGTKCKSVKAYQRRCSTAVEWWAKGERSSGVRLVRHANGPTNRRIKKAKT